jgi:PKD repeat protein
MKKLYLVLSLCMIGLTVLAQPVGRQKVIVEIGTGTWCQYCPGAALGADDLVSNGCAVGNIEYHNGDAYTNDASNARNSYYAVSGFPTAHFDGVLEYVGGSHTESMYPNYLPLYQQRMAVSSDFLVDIYGDHTGSTYNVQMVIHKVNGSHGQLTAQIVLTESEIVYSWQGQDHLNFVERLMAPTYEGTTVDFTDDNTQIVNVTFDMESDWVVNNCEVVCFLQDDGTKEILQGNMVTVPNLQVMPAMAGFACDNVVPCITTQVQFEDRSLGNIVSWNWTFEGGTPATSTDENPLITYNSQGQYDVQLTVYDGSVYNTLSDPNYILVITPPVQPQTPTGPTAICQDLTGIQYLTHSVQWATTYTWSVDPSAAGILSGPPDTVISFVQNQSYIGNFTIKVRADNSCGTGTWSQPLNCTTYLTPTQFTLSDGAGYCEGGEGIDLTLDGSQQGVSYELYLNNDPTGQVLAGNGSPLDFGNQTDQGIYTCLGSTDNCDKQMVGNTYIYVISAPVKAGKPAGSTAECNGNTATTYTTSGASGATSYTWTLNPSNAGVINGTTTTATVDWDNSFSGTANISVAGVNACFTGPSSDNLNVAVSESPEPVITGDNDVCDWEEGLVYNTPAVDGDTYNWELYNGHVTDGAGTNEVTVTWQDAGTGWIKVTQANATCTATTENFVVNIQDCVGIGEPDGNAFSIYPNPVKNELTIQFAGKHADSRMVIVNMLGQEVCDQMTGGSQQVIINTSDYSKGVYMLRMFGENDVMVKKFIKVE